MVQLQELENLVSVLYSSSDPFVRKNAEAQLIQFQSDAQAWIWSFELLKGSPNCQFFGALTLYTKINSQQWESFDHSEENINNFKDRLLQAYIALIGSQSFVVAKMTQSLVAFILRILPFHWPLFLSDVSQELESLATNNQDLGLDSTLAFLEFLKALVESVESIRLQKEKRSSLEQIFIDHQIQVVSVLLSLLANPSLIITRKCLETAKSWIHFGLPINAQTEILDAALNRLNEDQLLEPIIDMLLSLLSKNTIRQQKTIYFPKILFLLTDGLIGLKFNQSFADDPERLLLISQLFVEFGEAFTDSLVLSVGENLTDKFLLMMLNISGLDGVFPVDEEVSQSSLYFWFIFEETILELDLIGKGLNPCIIEIYTRLISILIKKSFYPFDWQSWSQDSKDRFLHFRNDIADTYGYCFEVIKEKTLEILIHCVKSSENDNFELLESSIFGIKSLSDFLSSNHYALLTHVFESILPLLETVQIDRLSITCLSFLSAFSRVLNETDHKYLNSSLKFIISSLKNPILAKDALKCLERVCFSCKVKLLDPMFGWVFDCMIRASAILEPGERYRLVASIMILIHQLPEMQSQLQECLLLKSLLQNLRNDRNSLLGPHLSCISAFIKSRSEKLFTIQDSAHWDTSLLQAYNSLCIEMETLFSLAANDAIDSSVCSYIADVKVLSNSTVELCRLELPAVYQNMPSLFNAALNCCTVQTHFQYYEVCSELSVIALQKIGDISLLQKLIEFTSLHLIYILDESPDTISLLWKSLSDIVLQSDNDFLKLSNFCMENVFKIFLPRTLGISDRFTLLSVMDFLIAVIQFQGSSSWSADLFSSIGPGICLALMNGIEGKMVPSILPKISEVLLKLTIKYPNEARLWLEAVLSDPNYLLNITQQEKKVFISGILGTRQVRKHRDLIKSFSVKCRGLDNTEFANSL